MLLLLALLIVTVTCAPLVALPLEIAPARVVALDGAFVPSDAQPLALAALVAFRAPPV